MIDAMMSDCGCGPLNEFPVIIARLSQARSRPLLWLIFSNVCVFSTCSMTAGPKRLSSRQSLPPTSQCVTGQCFSFPFVQGGCGRGAGKGDAGVEKNGCGLNAVGCEDYRRMICFRSIVNDLWVVGGVAMAAAQSHALVDDVP